MEWEVVFLFAYFACEGYTYKSLSSKFSKYENWSFEEFIFTILFESNIFPDTRITNFPLIHEDWVHLLIELIFENVPIFEIFHREFWYIEKIYWFKKMSDGTRYCPCESKGFHFYEWLIRLMMSFVMISFSVGGEVATRIARATRPDSLIFGAPFFRKRWWFFSRNQIKRNAPIRLFPSENGWSLMMK